jgi:hypothetical protein
MRTGQPCAGYAHCAHMRRFSSNFRTAAHRTDVRDCVQPYAAVRARSVHG